MKIIVLMIMMVLSNKAMASCKSVPSTYKSQCVFNRSVPEDLVLRKLYLENASYEELCKEYYKLKDNIAEQSHPGTLAMGKYNNNVDDYIKYYVNPRFQDMEHIKTKYPGVVRWNGRCGGL